MDIQLYLKIKHHIHMQQTASSRAYALIIMLYNECYVIVQYTSLSVV